MTTPTDYGLDAPKRDKPRTARERALVKAAESAYRSAVGQGTTPEDAWQRITNLIDDALVRRVVKAEEAGR